MRVLILLLISCTSSQSPIVEPDASSQLPIDAPPIEVACSGKQAQPRDASWTVAGRTVRVHVPASYDPTKRVPVVINIHGLASDGADQANVSRMNVRADAAGFVAVHPNGTGSPRGWNGGDCCNPATSSGVDDVAFVDALLDELEAKLCVDADRIHAIGLSNGGFLAHRLACELSPRIASIGAVAGVIGIETCSPSRPVPVFHVHGTSDWVIPYNGGGVNNSEPVATTVARWKAIHGCTAAPTTTFEQGDAKCVRHCDAIELCTIDDGGHQWPGGESIGTFNGKKSDNLDATGAAWTFFAAHPRVLRSQ